MALRFLAWVAFVVAMGRVASADVAPQGPIFCPSPDAALTANIG